jgi:hypothetical protein
MNARTAYIVAIRKIDWGSPAEGITHVALAGTPSAKAGGFMDVANAVVLVEQQKFQLRIRIAGEDAPVHIASAEDGQRYLRATPGPGIMDALLSLPPF